MSLDDFARNLVYWSPRGLLKDWVAKTLCFLGFHDDWWYHDETTGPPDNIFQLRRDTRFRQARRIFRLCGRCGSIR